MMSDVGRGLKVVNVPGGPGRLTGSVERGVMGRPLGREVGMVFVGRGRDSVGTTMVGPEVGKEPVGEETRVPEQQNVE